MSAAVEFPDGGSRAGDPGLVHPRHPDRGLEADFDRDPVAAAEWLFEGLALARQAGDEAWTRTVADFRHGALFHVTQEDPLTRRGYAKPRGYAGDAVLLDHVYGTWQEAAPTAVGAVLNRLVLARPFARAIRFRRQQLAEAIDAAAAAGQGACRVLAVSCGHLREFELSAAVRRGDLVEVTALDHDTATLLTAREVARRQGFPLVTHVASIAALIKRTLTLGGFDLAYTADLFDYLEDHVAVLVLERLLEAVRPGGRVVVANFGHDGPDAGYLEACMDWHLVRRSERRLLALWHGLPNDLRGPVEALADPGRNLSLLVATRPA
jgi:extracellular factor (EF) 3-hydroxypalmitic acid methyl ester biosynthesis protein